ncbi:MAG: hypothetical protein ABIP97_12850 [Chthoniobacterales bacterium]
MRLLIVIVLIVIICIGVKVLVFPDYASKAPAQSLTAAKTTEPKAADKAWFDAHKTPGVSPIKMEHRPGGLSEPKNVGGIQLIHHTPAPPLPRPTSAP